MKKALRYIDAHLSDELRLEDVAAHVYLSPYYFSKLFKKYQGIGFNAWVNQQRMASAKRAAMPQRLEHRQHRAEFRFFANQLFLQSVSPDLSGNAAGISSAN